MDETRSAKAAARRSRLAIIILLLLAVGVVLWLVFKLRYSAIDFRHNLWGPAYLLVHGQSPYRVDTLFESYINAVWFPQAIGLFFPLGWLDLQVAANIWFVGQILAVLFTLWWVWAELRPTEQSVPLPLFALTLLALAIFPPLLAHLLLGQVTLLAILLVLVSGRLVLERRFLPAGLLIAPAVAKPQLLILAVPGLWLASIRTGGRRGAVLFPAAILLGSALLTVPLWVGYPAWVPDFIRALQRNPDWYQPTLYTMMWVCCGRAWQIGPALLSGSLFGLNLWLWWRQPPEEVLPWSLALTTLASPYIWTWDFVLFFPLIFRLLFRHRTRVARAAWGIGYLLLLGAQAWVRYSPNNSEYRYFWVPWVLFLIILGAHAAESRLSGSIPPVAKKPPREKRR